MKSKKLILLVTSCAAIATVAGVTIQQLNNQTNTLTKADVVTYHLRFDANNNVFDADITGRTAKTVFTDSKYPLTCVVNAFTRKSGYWGSFSDGGYFYLDSLVHGLKKVTIVFEGDGTLGIHGGADSAQLAGRKPTGSRLTHFDDIASGTAYEFENGMNTFEIYATGAVDIKSIDTEYTCADDAKENEYGVIENSNGHVHLNSTTIRAGVSYLGLNDVKVGNKVQFTFKGKNIPNVVAFADTDHGNYVGTDKSEGIAIMTANVENKTDDDWKRMMPFGPYRLDTVSGSRATTYRQPSYLKTGMGCGSLNDEHNYKYVIALNPFTDTTTCHITASLTDLTDNTTISKEITFDTKVNDTDLEIYKNTNFIIYGQSDEIEFDYEVITGLTAKDSYKATFDSGTNTATLQKGTGGSEYTDLSYLDFGAYETGAYVGMEFTGKYKPQVAFFADGGHKAFKSDAASCYVWTDDYVASKYRINSKTDCATNIYDNIEALNKVAYNNLSEDGKYYLAIATRLVNSKYQFDYNFYTVSGTTLTLQGTWSMERNPSTPETSGTHIVVYGSRITNLTTKLAIADTLEGVLQGYTVAATE